MSKAMEKRIEAAARRIIPNLKERGGFKGFCDMAWETGYRIGSLRRDLHGEADCALVESAFWSDMAARKAAERAAA